MVDGSAKPRLLFRPSSPCDVLRALRAAPSDCHRAPFDDVEVNVQAHSSEILLQKLIHRMGTIWPDPDVEIMIFAWAGFSPP